MKKSVLIWIAAIFFACSTPAHAEEGPFEKLGEVCGEAIDNLCSDVPIGQGGVLICLEKNKDKVSEACNQARVDAEKKFEEQAAADTEEGPYEKLGAVCGEEIESLCSDFAIGEGGILACLEKNQDKISELCNNARVNAEKQFKEDQEAADDLGVDSL